MKKKLYLILTFLFIFIGIQTVNALDECYTCQMSGTPCESCGSMCKEFDDGICRIKNDDQELNDPAHYMCEYMGDFTNLLTDEVNKVMIRLEYNKETGDVELTPETGILLGLYSTIPPYYSFLADSLKITAAENLGKCPSKIYVAYSPFITISGNGNRIDGLSDFINYIGDKDIFNTGCQNLTVYQDRFDNAISKYKECKLSGKNSATCLSSAISEVNSSEDLLKTYCDSILQSYTYDGAFEEDCIVGCLGASRRINEAKKDSGLSSGAGDCGFSSRVLVWINNIMRWIKYILPVIVIILGIADFIKAMSADKEDEMKKAQGRFVKRLISAAIVFVVPLLIEFILNMMGFRYDSCSLF